MNMEDLFQGFDPSRYEDEARHRWGTSDAFVEAEKRTRRYTPDDWKALMAEQTAIYEMRTPPCRPARLPLTKP